MTFSTFAVLILFLIVFWHWQRPKQMTIGPQKLTGDAVSTNSQPEDIHLPTPSVATHERPGTSQDHGIAVKNVPIRFWGKVVDQDGTLVPGVTVVVGIRQWFTTPTTRFTARDKMFRLQTDAAGLFSIGGEVGDSLSIDNVMKAGYELSPNAPRGFSYGGPDSFGPNPTNPVVFHMWKGGESQSLLQHRLSRVGIPCDGQPARFDLITGKRVSEGGHLLVRLWRDPVLLAKPNDRYGWVAEFEMLDGGLALSSDEFMYEAPLDGYERLWRVEVTKKATNWISTLTQRCYIKLNHGAQFGRMDIKLTTNYNPPPTGLTIDLAINPNGLRSLQP